MAFYKTFLMRVLILFIVLFSINQDFRILGLSYYLRFYELLLIIATFLIVFFSKKQIKYDALVKFLFLYFSWRAISFFIIQSHYMYLVRLIFTSTLVLSYLVFLNVRLSNRFKEKTIFVFNIVLVLITNFYLLYYLFFLRICAYCGITYYNAREIRLSGLYLDPNNLSIALIFPLIYFGYKILHFKFSFLSILFLALTIIPLYFTQSKTGLFMLVISLVLLIIHKYFVKYFKTTSLIIFMSIPHLLILLYVYTPNLNSFITGSAGAHINLINASSIFYKYNYYFGTGTGQFGYVLKNSDLVSKLSKFDPSIINIDETFLSHSFYTESLSENGLIGFLFFVIFYSLLMYKLLTNVNTSNLLKIINTIYFVSMAVGTMFYHLITPYPFIIIFFLL